MLKIDQDVTLSLTDACDVVINGCAETNGFASASVYLMALLVLTKIMAHTIMRNEKKNGFRQ